MYWCDEDLEFVLHSGRGNVGANALMQFHWDVIAIVSISGLIKSGRKELMQLAAADVCIQEESPTGDMLGVQSAS